MATDWTFCIAAQRGIATLGLATLLAGCGSGSSEEGGQGRRRGAQGPAEVGFIVAKTEPVTVTTELPARVTAFMTADVRPQINGVIRRRLFTEGSFVRAGQPLYEVESELYRAAADQAAAQLESAQANQIAAQLAAERYKALVAMQAVGKQEADNAIALSGQARAAVALNTATLKAARINLRYTIIRAPISGQIGRSAFTPGALISANQTAPLATIQQIDPVYVDIQQSSAALLEMRSRLAGGGALPTRAGVRLKLDGGRDLPGHGTLEFSEVTVDATTGAVTMRALFPNPSNALLPGLFVRAVVPQSVNPAAILVPQPGITRNPRGEAVALVLGRNDTVEQRTVQTDGIVGNSWIVSSGIRVGDRVIVEGSAKAKVGERAIPVPASKTVGGTAPPPTAHLPKNNGTRAPGGQGS